MISTVLRDNVFLQMGPMKVYPNMYIMFLAPSGAARKGFPPQVAFSFLKEIDNTKLLSGRSSIQGVLAELAGVETNSKGLIQKKGATGLLYAEELAASFVGDPAVVNLLTDMYDYREEYPIRLKDSAIMLKNVCFGMLVATNSAMLEQLYDERAKEGGLIGRTFIISEKTRRHKNSLVFEKPFDPEKKKKLLEHLRLLSQLRGIATVDEEAKQYYHEWYNSFDDDIEDKSGFIHRAHNGVCKVALTLAAAELDINETKTITVKLSHLVEAVKQVFKIKNNQQIITLGQGKNPNAQQVAIFIKAISNSKNYQITRRELLQKHFCDFDIGTLESIVLTLESGGMLKTTSILNETGYQLTELCKKEVLGHEAEQKKRQA